MNQYDRRKLLSKVTALAKLAGDEIMKSFRDQFEIFHKRDSSPVTNADRASEKIIVEGLRKLTPNFPVIAEEEVASGRKVKVSTEAFWLVDPLDGTKEFIKKNNEFTVNIALLKENQPIFGVVFAPALDILYWGCENKGSYRSNIKNSYNSISVNSQLSDPVQIAGSRSHPSIKMNAFTSQFEKYEVKPMGSSLKICLVADGSVHFYPRLGPTMEWDTAAAHAVLRAAEGEMMKYGTNEPLEYNKRNLLNPEFIAGNMHNIQSLKR